MLMGKAVVAVLIAVILIISLLAVYMGMVRKPETIPPIKTFKLTSPAFEEGGYIPRKYTCEGDDVSPPLSWEDYPSETKSFVLIVEDPDAPRGVFTHWIAYNIPADVNMLEEGVERVEKLPSGIMQGVNDFGRIGYGGPCPPPGKPHRYVFKLYALDVVLDLEPGASKDEVLKAMSGHILAEATLTGLYSRSG